MDLHGGVKSLDPLNRLCANLYAAEVIFRAEHGFALLTEPRNNPQSGDLEYQPALKGCNSWMMKESGAVGMSDDQVVAALHPCQAVAEEAEPLVCWKLPCVHVPVDDISLSQI